MRKVEQNQGPELMRKKVGTYQVRDRFELEGAVVAALDAGYRSFDTAAVYRNEHILADCLSQEIKKVLEFHDDLDSKYWIYYLSL